MTLRFPPQPLTALLCSAIAFTALCAAGCAAQLDAGEALRAPDGWPRVVRVGGRLLDMRQHGPTLGLEAAGTIDGGQLNLRSAATGVGYRVRPLRPPFGFGFEGSLDLGMGEPAFVDYDGIGGYVGTQLRFPYRIAGCADFDEDSYHSFAVLVDLVTSARAGVWTPPAGTDDGVALGDLSGHLGVQLIFGSDFARAPHASGTTPAEAAP